MGHSPHTRDLCPRGCLPSWCLRQNGRVGHFFLRVPDNQEAGCETDGVAAALFGHFSRALSVFFRLLSKWEKSQKLSACCLIAIANTKSLAWESRNFSLFDLLPSLSYTLRVFFFLKGHYANDNEEPTQKEWINKGKIKRKECNLKLD